MNFPSKKWIKQRLKNNLTKPLREKIIDVFVIGSFANGTHNDESDLDIAVVIPNKQNISSVKFSERYHSHFIRENQKPKWENRIIDFQFYYKDDKELKSISIKVKLK